MAKFVRYAVLLIVAAFTVLPFLYLVANALKTYPETVTRVSPNPLAAEFWPASPQWNNFALAWSTQDLGAGFLRSLVISSVTAIGVLVTSVLAAFAFAKLRFRGREALFGLLLVTLMVPETVSLVPNFLVISALGWVDKLPALTVPFLANAFAIFLLRQFFRQVPDALIEMAAIDGCSYGQILRRIVVPLSIAPLLTVAFLEFSGSWNALQWPLVVTRSADWRPISVALARFVTEAGPETQLRFAGALMSLVPTVVVFLAAQKHITEAVTSVGIKE